MIDILSAFKKENKALLTCYNVGLLQGKAFRALHDHLAKTLKPYDLTVTEWKILGQLFDNGQLQLNEIAKLLEVEPPLITKLIDALEEKKLVLKSSENKDRRIKVVIISKKGKSLIPLIEIEVKACLKNLLKGIKLAELLIYAKVLKTIVNNSIFEIK